MTHVYYNKTNFPRFIANNGNWDIYAKEDGYCAAIPTEAAARIGCKASSFGDEGYVRVTLGVEVKP